MKILHLSQTKDREAWLDARRGVITGTKSKGMKPLSRGTDRTPAGFWQLLAERLAIAKDGEPERDRGNRLEEEGLKLTAKQYKIKLNYDPGMWVSDFDSDIAVSPDGAEPGDEPTYAIEVKALDSQYHIKAIVKDRRAKKEEGYNPWDSLCFDSNHDFKAQAVQYFAVNEHLQKLYFTLYDDRMALDHLVHYTIVIERSHVQEAIDEQIESQKTMLTDLRALLKELANER